MKKNWMILSVVLGAFLGSYSVQAGLNYEYYEGDWDNLPNFDSLTPVKTGIETDPNAFRLYYRDQDEYFGFRYIGYIEVSTTGNYTFYTNSDDGSALYIGNSLVVDNGGTHGMTERSGSINLTAGMHAITVTFFNKTGPFGLEVRYAGPGIPKTLIPGDVLYSMGPPGDLNADRIVNVLDLKILTDDWLTDNITPVLPTETLDDMEIYQPGGPYPVPNQFLSWAHYEYPNPDCAQATVTPSVIIEPNEIPQGDQAIRIVFDFPPVCGGGADWVMAGHFISNTDLKQYDELRFWKRNHGPGHEDIRWEIILGSNYPSGTYIDEHMVCRIGPFSSTEDPNEWHEVVVDLRNDTNVNWESPYGKIEDVQYIHGIVVLAISDYPGEITVDVDDFRLLDYTPTCSGLPVADLNRDCKLDLFDYAILGANFLKEAGP